MGNWRTVNLSGTMSAEDAAKLNDALDYGECGGPRYRTVWGSPYACLSFSSTSPGLAGLGGWPAQNVDRCGNLAERDFSVEDVAGALRALVYYAPSMLLKIHCGGDWESQECVATISVGEGLVVVGKPERETIEGPPAAQIQENLMRNLLR